VYQHTQQADKSARCCLQTLDRQALSLTPDELCFQANEWVSNAIQVCGQRPVSVPVMAPVAVAVLERAVLYQHPRLWGIVTGTSNLLNRPRGGKAHGAEAVALRSSGAPGRAASGRALAPEPPRANRVTFAFGGIFKKNWTPN